MRIGIIGMGVAGISVLRELRSQLDTLKRKETEIVIFADEHLFGTGLAFQADDDSLLINQYTETMTIIPEQPDDFVNWVKKNKGIQTVYHTHLPRTWFGEYLNEHLDRWIQELNVTVRFEKISAIEPQDNGSYLLRSNCSRIEVDVVHLTTGVLAYQDPYKLKGTEKYVYNPYPARRNIQVTGESTVGIIGTGLTALDVMLYIQETYPSAKIMFFSKDGLFSSVRGDERQVSLHYFCEDRLAGLLAKGESFRLNTVLEWFFNEMEENDIDLNWVWTHLGSGTVEGMNLDLKYAGILGKFQSIVRQMRKCYPLIWKALSDEDKQIFIRDYGKQWQRFKAPIPQNTARQLIERISNEEVGLISGVKGISKQPDHFSVQTETGECFSVDYVINCTGQDTNLEKSAELHSELIQNLLNDGLLSPCRFGGAQIDYPSMSTIDRYGNIRRNFKAYGQLVSGVHYGNNNVELISDSAVKGVFDSLSTKNRPVDKISRSAQ
ncbi:hypothetical protein ADIAL_1310 [Alkalibacterium sp. AK22]|uniref:FAD/NAD(P)-binding protein n=1 Tax=Alkalibacterium sp. AK22 TaxID=1229520 RepID=UPI000452D276|nr:FAD/NAD(P)-binding protein [Alkalibacterium sp. AK22]EXJ23163.1 hypothetical protein ADIAL_1310 [Alkalibacterium sp. AK22]